MSKIWKFIPSRFFTLFLLAGVAASPLAHGENDIEIGMKSKALVDKIKKEELEMRAEADKKIADIRKRALEELEKLLVKYDSPDKKAESDLIAAEISKLKKKLGIKADNVRAAGDNKVTRNSKNNQYFKYRTSYVFDKKGFITGKFIFMPEKKVRVIYKYKGKKESSFWEWMDMGDHVQIDSGSVLGKIIISERPNSNLKTLLVRWGGELKHKLTDANSE